MAPTGCVLSTAWKDSRITVSRFRHDEKSRVRKALPAHDAYVLVSQIKPLPAHDLWIEGKHQRVRGNARATLNVLDLSAATSCAIAAPFECVMMHIPRPALAHIADEAVAPPISGLHAPEGWDTFDPVVQNVQAGIVEAMERGGTASQLFVDHMLVALLAHVAQSYGGMRDGAQRRTGGLAPWQERRAKELIAANLIDGLSLQQIAEQTGLSVSHFARAFKKSTGATPYGWLLARRIDRAKDLLRESDQPLAEIAVRTGFADQSHFTKTFTRFAGTTPGVWRRARCAA